MHLSRLEAALQLLLVVGFAAVDFLFFHDALKPGEVITPAQWLVGVLSMLVFISAATALLRTRMSTTAI